MRNITQLFFLAAFFVLSFGATAQDGVNEVRFVIRDAPACSAPFGLYVDLEVKSGGDAGFFMSEQNYRFSFNRDALANPVIVDQYLAGIILGGPGANGFALFAPHNLAGSLDTVVSYNVELQGGDGLFITPDEWVPVGQIGFDVLSEDACIELKWHDKATFPATFVGEVYTDFATGNEERTNTGESNYANISDCFVDLCGGLPVELTSFEGEERNCKIHLNWRTATERNSSHFIIERSADAEAFLEIGRTTAAGNSDISVDYSFIDAAVSTSSYYRLKQVDFDGTYAYSKVIQVDADCFAGNFTDIHDVFPNPVGEDGQMNIRLYTNSNESSDLVILNIEGKELMRKTYELVEGTNLLETNLRGIAAGTYFMHLEANGWRSRAQKIVKLDN